MNAYLKLFFRRIVKDFHHKELLPLKLLFFIHASTIFIVYPYLTIHMRELGINVEETAIMSGITPVVSILMPPIAGLIADKIGNYKILLALFSSLGGVAVLLFLFVPVGRVTITYPDEVLFSLSCNRNLPMTLSMYQEYPCTPLHPFTYNTKIRMEACGFVCQAHEDQNVSGRILNASAYGLQIHDTKANSTTIFKYELPKRIASASEFPLVHNMKLKMNAKYTSSVRKLSRNSFFFPTPNLYNFSCDLRENMAEPSPDSNFSPNLNLGYTCLFSVRKFRNGFSSNSIDIGIQPRSKSENDVSEDKQMYNLDYIKHGSSLHKNLTCLDNFPQNDEYISISIPGDSLKSLDLGSCAPRCIGTSPRKRVCTNHQVVKEIDMKLTFWSYLAVRVFLGMISGTAFAMFEGAVIALLREHKADYGLQRIYATIGGMITSPLSGWLIDFASKDKDYTDFRPIFFLYAALKILSGALMLFINLEFKTPANDVVTDVFSVLRKVEMCALLIVCFLLGTAWGFIESFLFWLIQDLGGSKSLMGITITVGGIAGIPLLVMSGPIIKRLGHANVLFIGFIFYAIRLIGYSVIYNPWLVLIFEAMESITSSLSFTAAVTYAAKLSTVTTDTSIQGLVGGLYYGVGKGAGSLIGGYSIKIFGTRETYVLFAAGTAISGVIYFCFNHMYMKHRPSEGTDITRKDSRIPAPLNDDVAKKLPEIMNGDVTAKEPLPYEDSLTNFGYEDTETEEPEKSCKV